jgi:mRNA interferase MazF
VVDKVNIAERFIVNIYVKYVDRSGGKHRPCLILGKLPGSFDDWMICPISSKIDKIVDDYDVPVLLSEVETKISGLKVDSVVKSLKLAVVNRKQLPDGAIGLLPESQFLKVKSKIIKWLS